MVSHNQDERTPLLAPQNKRSNGSLRSTDPVQDDDLDFDARFKKFKAAVARKFRGKAHREATPALLITHFDGLGQARPVLEARRAAAFRDALHEVTAMSSAEFRHQVEQVNHAIAQGIYPKMITTGSSGSYFVRIISRPSESAEAFPELTTVAVFKPKDEEPYGNLNPKRQFLRKYLWWAMGRPCLIPNFSYLSEVGASYLDSRLALQMVPRTELVELSSPTFHYAYSDRTAFDKDNVPLPNKIGSYQTFLKGYVNASDFLRRHPWPSRTRSKTLLMRDMDDESRAHKVSRRKERARLRNCGVAIKRTLLCRPSWDDLYPEEEPDPCHPASRNTDSASDNQGSRSPQHDAFYWTPKRMEQFRLQLERLVVLDFLMRNTDRGLDNFMIKHDIERDEIKIGAIDNSLSFPIKHPNEIRQYPFGWLFLPTDLIGLPFSDSTREHLLPILSDPAWWQHTVHGLKKIFQQDPYFDQAKFERQMSVMRGQGWNLVQSLQAPDEGPLDLCAREKKLIRQEVQELQVDKLEKLDGVKVPLDSSGQVLPPAEIPESPTSGIIKPATGKPPIPRTISSGLIETERRPIGMRASESYRKALLQAAGTDGASDDADEPQMDEQPLVQDSQTTVGSTVSASLPQDSALMNKLKSDVFADETEPEAKGGSRHSQRSRHQRFASAHDVGTFHRRRHQHQRDLLSSYDDADNILGRTGIEVLEGLDRQRKQQKGKLYFFRTRQRSSTVTNHGPNINNVNIGSEDGGKVVDTVAARERENLEDANGSGGGRKWDLSSSIVSDPGGSRWDRGGRSRSLVRPIGDAGMVGSLYDLQSQGEVLSEEEEEEDDEDDDERTSTRKRIVRGGGNVVPTIQSVLQAHDSRFRNGEQSTSGVTSLTPHIPHPTSIGTTSQSSAGNKRTATIKVIVEKLSSDTKQAWLKWI